MIEKYLTKCQNLQIVANVDDLRIVINKILDEREAEKHSQEDVLLKAADVRKILNISSATLHRWKANGYLKYLKVGNGVRFRQSDVLQLLEERK